MLWGPLLLQRLREGLHHLTPFQDLAVVCHLRFTCRSQSADSRISASLIVPFELEYMKRLQCEGWNSAAVMTSVSSSILTGLISTTSAFYEISIDTLESKHSRTKTLITDIQVP